MVGNDVVDLGDPEVATGARHPRFDARAFAPCERRRIEAAGAEAAWRWILWAAKESAFKAARRRDPAAVFAPARFVVQLDAELRGSVRFGGEAYPVRVTRSRDWVHAVATAPGGSPDAVLAGVRRLTAAGDGDRLGEAPSREARAFAIAAIAARLSEPADSLAILRRGRIPRLQRRDGREVADLSLAHHGRFVAYACAPPQARGGDRQ